MALGRLSVEPCAEGSVRSLFFHGVVCRVVSIAALLAPGLLGQPAEAGVDVGPSIRSLWLVHNVVSLLHALWAGAGCHARSDCATAATVLVIYPCSVPAGSTYFCLVIARCSLRWQ